MPWARVKKRGEQYVFMANIWLGIGEDGRGLMGFSIYVVIRAKSQAGR
jgi:hypothetical protein